MASKEQDIAKAERFHLWYKEDGLQQALQDIRQMYIDGLINTGTKDEVAREKYYTAIKCMDSIEGHILGVIGGGKVADKELQRVKKEYSKPKLLNII